MAGAWVANRVSGQISGRTENERKNRGGPMVPTRNLVADAWRDPVMPRGAIWFVQFLGFALELVFDRSSWL